MFWLFMHLFSWILLLSIVIYVICVKGKTNKVVKMIARCCYIVAIISGIFLFKYAWMTSPFLAIIKVLLAVGLIAFCEIYFSNEKKMKGSLKFLLILFIIIVGIIGFVLAGGRPFV